MRRLALDLGGEIRRLRVDAGLTLSELAGVVGVHRSHIARIESASTRPSLEVLTAIGTALGADLSVRFFAGSGPRLRDRFQAPMIEALLRAIDARWAPDVEVAVNHPMRGVIDVVLIDRGRSIILATEVHSEIRRLEEQLRRAAEKADGLARRFNRDGQLRSGAVSRLLILRSTVTTREVARAYRATLEAAYPARTAACVDSLTSNAPWPGPGIVWMQVAGGDATLMRFPPRGVELGR